MIFSIRGARRVIVTCLVGMAAGAACDRAPEPAGEQVSAVSETPANTGLVQEARAFMDSYAGDLLAGNREAIAARYHRNGAYFLGNGRKEFMPYASIAALYSGDSWSPPVSFEWRDLSFEPLGSEAVVVAGSFRWGAGSGMTPMVLSYTGLLRRQEGELRIRLEDESVDPRSLPAVPAQPDSLESDHEGGRR